MTTTAGAGFGVGSTQREVGGGARARAASVSYLEGPPTPATGRSNDVCSTARLDATPHVVLDCLCSYARHPLLLHHVCMFYQLITVFPATAFNRPVCPHPHTLTASSLIRTHPQHRQYIRIRINRNLPRGHSSMPVFDEHVPLRVQPARVWTAQCARHYISRLHPSTHQNPVSLHELTMTHTERATRRRRLRLHDLNVQHTSRLRISIKHARL